MNIMVNLRLRSAGNEFTWMPLGGIQTPGERVRLQAYRRSGANIDRNEGQRKGARVYTRKVQKWAKRKRWPGRRARGRMCNVQFTRANVNGQLRVILWRSRSGGPCVRVQASGSYRLWETSGTGNILWTRADDAESERPVGSRCTVWCRYHAKTWYLPAMLHNYHLRNAFSWFFGVLLTVRGNTWK